MERREEHSGMRRTKIDSRRKGDETHLSTGTSTEKSIESKGSASSSPSSFRAGEGLGRSRTIFLRYSRKLEEEKKKERSARERGREEEENGTDV